MLLYGLIWTTAVIETAYVYQCLYLLQFVKLPVYILYIFVPAWIKEKK